MLRHLIFILTSIYAISLPQWSTAADHLLLNEVMISNVDGYMADYEFPDSWVELYNPTSKPIDLKGMYLQQERGGKKQAYKLPSIKIPPKGYLVICCDKQGQGIHASFKLDADGAELRLLNNRNKVIDHMTYPPMLAPGIGYGRTQEDSNQWKWEAEATPGTDNHGTFTDTLLPEPQFSLSGRIITDMAHVDITIPTGIDRHDAMIYLTLDGSEPTRESSHSQSFSFDIEKTTVIRAKVMASDAIPSRTVSHSFIRHHRQTTIPIISILADSVHLFDSRLGIFSSDTISGDIPNYKQPWRRPANIEILSATDEGPNVNQLCEMAVAGSSSRVGKQKSMKFFADERFEKKHFDGAFWKDKPLLYRNKSFMMRNGGSVRSSSRITDAFAQKLFGTHVNNLDWQAYEPVIGYINGRYYGIFELRERSNKYYVWANHGKDKSEIERVDYIRKSSSKGFKKLKKLCQRKSTTYADLEPHIDMEEWANILCVQIFAANTDWPFNNASLWRPLTRYGKWRWVLKDVDYIGRILRPDLTDDMLSFNYLKYLTITGDTTSQEVRMTHRAPTAFFLFQKLLTLPEFRDLLVDRLAVYLGDFLKPEVTTTLLTQMHDQIYDEVDQTFRRVFTRGKVEMLSEYIGHVSDFLRARPRRVYQHLSDFYPELGNVIPISITAGSDSVYVNGIPLTEGNFDGAYFTNRELRLSSGNPDKGWAVTIFHRESTGALIQSKEPQKISSSDVTLWLRAYEMCDSIAFSTIQQ